MSTTPAPPATVKLGALTFTIEMLEPRDGNAHEAYGFVRHEQQRICIDPQHGPERAALSVLHELLHAVGQAQPVDLGEKDAEEKLVRGLTAALGATMRDSPEVWLWMLERHGLDLERVLTERQGLKARVARAVETLGGRAAP